MARLLRDDRVDPNLVNDRGRTALMYGAARNHLDVVEKLLADKRVDANIAESHGWTAILYAACKGHNAVVEAFVASDKVTVPVGFRPGDGNNADDDDDAAQEPPAEWVVCARSCIAEAIGWRTDPPFKIKDHVGLTCWRRPSKNV